jgi:hypothetical protein
VTLAMSVYLTYREHRNGCAVPLASDRIANLIELLP